MGFDLSLNLGRLINQAKGKATWICQQPSPRRTCMYGLIELQLSLNFEHNFGLLIKLHK